MTAVAVEEQSAAPRVAPFWRTTALLLGLAAVLCAGLIAAIVALTDISRREDMESLGFLVVFGLICPACVAVGLALDRLPGRWGRVDVGILTAALLVGVLTAGALGRVADWAGAVSNRNNTTVVAALMVLAVVGAVLLSALPTRFTHRRLVGRALVLLAIAAGIVMALSFSASSVLTVGDLVIAAVVGVAVAFLIALAPSMRSAPVIVDVLFCAVLVLVAIDLSNPPFDTGGVHQAFYLGPTNSILLGRPMLTETFSQYGAGMFEVLAGIFHVVPLGFGTFSLMTGLATGLELSAAYAAMRLAGVRQIVSLLCAVLIVAVNMFEPIGTFVSYPSTGALRFGWTWLLILAGIAAFRWPGRRALQVAPYVVFGISCVWSFEGLIYSGAVAVVLALTAERLRAPTVRAFLRGTAVRLGLLVAVFLTSHLVFAVLVRVFAGAWPKWGDYIEFVRVYSVNGFGTIPIGTWQVGLVIAFLYVCSVIVLARLLITRPPEATRSPITVVLLAAVTAFGIASFTYWLGRSHPQNQLHIAPIAIVLVTVWWSWTERVSAWRTPRDRLAPALIPGLLFGLLAVGAWTFVSDSLPNTLPGQLIAGGPSRVADRISALWHVPVINSDVGPALRLEQRYAGNAPTARLLSSSDDVELAMRSGRLNSLPWSDPAQDDLIFTRTWPRVERAIAAMPDRTWLITDGPNADWTHLQYKTVAALRDRYDFEEVARDGIVRIDRLTAKR